MKRQFSLLASLLLVIAMVFTLASCDFIKQYLPGNDEHTHNYVDGKCEECGESDPDYKPEHTHNYVDGKCECGESDPNYKPECTEHAYSIEVTKPATCTEAGEKTLTCTLCGHVETSEIAPNGHTEVTVPGTAPTCTEDGLSGGKKCSVCGEDTEKQSTISAAGHDFANGASCSVCGEANPDYNGPKTYVLDSGTLALKDKVDEEGLDSIVLAGNDDFFSIYLAKKTKIEENSKTFEDGFAGTKRLNWQTQSVIDGDNSVAVIKFTVDGSATVKVWWVSGGDGRTVAIYNTDGSILTQGVAADSVKNSLYITELVIPEAGTYYLGNIDGSNNFYKVEATVTPTAEAPKNELKVTTTDTYGFFDLYSFTAEEEGYYTFNLPAGLGFYSKAKYDIYADAEVDYYSNENGAIAVVGIKAGETLEFYVGAITKADWVITWTFEAGEVIPEVIECNHWWELAMGHEQMVLPTCQAGGVLVYECWNCGEIKIEEVDPDTEYGHDYVLDETTYVETTCTTDGYKKETCSICSDVKETTLDHTIYGMHDNVLDEESYKEATCQEGGYSKYTCSVCGEVTEETTEASVWAHQDVYSSNYAISTCSVCNRVQLGVYVEATETTYGIQFGMSYANGSLFFAVSNADNSVFEMYGYTATLADGVYTVTLVNNNAYETSAYGLLNATITVKPACGGVDVTITPAEGEAVVLKNYEGDGVHSYFYSCDKVCQECFEETNPDADHTIVHVEAKAATCTANGNIEYWYCSDCGYAWADEALTQQTNQMSVVLPAPGHADEDGNYKCDTCSVALEPAADSVLTIPQAIALATAMGDNYTANKYYITGVVLNISNTFYGNLNIVDGNGTQLYVYGLYSSDGVNGFSKLDPQPVAGDEVTIYTVVGCYYGTPQAKDAWLNAHTVHGDNHVWADATCKAPKTCTVCGATDGEALEHSYVDGSCTGCGKEQPAAGATVTTKLDLSGLTNSGSYKTVTVNGWEALNAAVQSGGASDANPVFTFIGTSTDKALCLNGKTTAVGKLTSATLSGGLSKLSFNYGLAFTDSSGVDITINIKQNGAVVASKQLDNNNVTQKTAYEFVWELDSVIEGDFVIEIVNNCPSNNSSNNKDRVSIFNIEWVSAPVAE